MTFAGFSGLSFEDQMLEFERQALREAQQREEDEQREADRLAAIAAARAREEAAARIAAPQEADRLAKIAADRRAAERAATTQAAADRRAADIAAARARDEAADRIAASLEARTPVRTPRLSEVLGGAGPSNPPVRPRVASDPPRRVAARTPGVPAASAARAVGVGSPGGLEIAALELADGGELRAQNAARRRAFDAVPDGSETRAALELAAAATSPSRLTADAEERLFASALAQDDAAAVAGPPSVLRQVREALREEDERLREAKVRDIASTVPLGLESLDAFRLERELDAHEAAMRSELDEPGHPDAVPRSATRPPLLSSSGEPVSDFEAHASFVEGRRRHDDAVTAIQRATGAARAADVADRLEEQSALDAAFRREILGEVGGVDLIRAMDAEAAVLEAAQQREMLADPGGAAVLRAREPERRGDVNIGESAEPVTPTRDDEDAETVAGLRVPRVIRLGDDVFPVVVDPRLANLQLKFFASIATDDEVAEIESHPLEAQQQTATLAQLLLGNRFTGGEPTPQQIAQAFEVATGVPAPLPSGGIQALRFVGGVASILDAFTGIPVRAAVRHPGDVFSPEALDVYWAAVEDPSTVQLRDSGPARILPDQDLIFGISPRDAAGGVLDSTLALDNLAGGVGLVRGGLRALDDAFIAASLREAAPEAGSRSASAGHDVVGIRAGTGVPDGFDVAPGRVRAPDVTSPAPVPSIGRAEILGQAVRSSGREIGRSATEHASALVAGVVDDLTRPLTTSEALIKMLPREMQPITSAVVRAMTADFADFAGRFQERAVTEFVGLGFDAARTLTTQFQRALSRLRARGVGSVGEAIGEVQGQIEKVVRESPAAIEARRQIEIEIFLQGLEDRTMARMAAQAGARQLEDSAIRRVVDLFEEGLRTYQDAFGFEDVLLDILARVETDADERSGRLTAQAAH